MGFKDQLVKLKDNWFLIVIVLLVLFFFSGGSSFSNVGSSFSKSMVYSEGMMDSAIGSSGSSYRGSYGGYIPPSPGSGDFAPDVVERKITKTTSMNVEVERGKFKDKEDRLKAIVTSSDSYLLSGNANRYGTEKNQYYNGYYSIKVDTKKYDAVVSQLKELGEVTSFNENQQDITGSYTNTEIEIEAEKARLERYNKMYNEATLVADKITLNDRIFDQERRVGYLQDSLKNMDQRVDYSTVTVSLNEKQSSYANIAIVKFSELVRKLVSSLNSLFSLLFILLPYAVAALIIWGIVKLVRRNR
ncbi:MAG: DUF4349 domain-containing protein [Nanoarchaeota archaeon]|nr:DUF4349 domain-containing protein [Nanoarchaeota archaeon]